MCSLDQTFIFHICADNYSAGVQIIIEGFTLTEKLRTEDDVLATSFLTDALCISNRNGRLDDHNCIRVIFHDQPNHSLDCRCVEKVFLAVVVRRSRNNNKVRIAVGEFGVQRCGQIQLLFSQILLNIFILNRRLPVID